MENTKQINPWRDIWVRPRSTLRYQLEKNPNQWVIVLAILNGVISGIAWLITLSATYTEKEVFRRPLLVIAMLIAGALMGLISLYVGAWLYKVTGRWLGGKGHYPDLKCAVGWSYYPYLVSGIFSILNAITVEKQPVLSLLFGLIAVVLLIWAFIITLKLVGEAHEFSAWRALGAVFIAAVIIFIIFVIILLIIPLLQPLVAKLI